MAEMHPLLAALLAEYRAGKHSEAQYEVLRKKILQDEIGLGAGTTFAAPKLPTAENGVTVVSKAELQRQEQDRIQDAIDAGRKSGKMYSFTAKAEVRAVTRAVPVVGGKGDAMRFLNDEEFAQARRAAEQVAATRADRAKLPAAPIDDNGSTLDLPPGFEIVNGMITRVVKAAPREVNPEVEAIRARWKAGEFGPTKRVDGKKCEECRGSKKVHGNSCVNCLGSGIAPPDSLVTARKLIDAIQEQAPITEGRIDCPTCKGKPDKIIGKMCTCGGKGHLKVDMTPVIARSNRGATCADPLQESPEALSYTAYLATGLTSTIHAESGPKAVRSAVNSLKGGAGFTRIKLDRGCMLVLHDYDTQCEQCHGKKILNGKTCTYCQDGRVTRRGKRFFFDDQEATFAEDGTPKKPFMSAKDLAHEAGLRAMSGYDPDATCGRNKCKAGEGQVCFACEDAKQGGYQVKGYVPCSECKATGKIKGVPHEKCRGKGRFNPIEFYWISDQPLPCKACAGKSDNVKKHCPSCAGSCQVNAFTVTDEIRRHDVLEEDRLPLRDRPLTIMIGGDKVVVGAGKVPSRKSGSFMHLTGTARNRWDTAQKLYGAQEIVGEGSKARWSHKPTQGIGAGQTVKPYTATFSKG